MPATNPELYARLMAFRIDEGTPDLTFEARLARENGWDIGYTRRALTEYRRFLFLAMTAGHTVCPSEEVDQAWHFHLTYTRSYWDRLCGELLGRPLHHSPSRGGHDEAAKYRDLYTRTLASYRAAFGAEPPADIWPSVDVRFGDDLQVVRVNKAQNWVVPKAAVRRTVLVGGIALAGIVCATGCGGVVANPFDLEGKSFVWFLIPVIIAALILGLVWRYRLGGPDAQPDDDSPGLDWGDAAYLSGGKHRLTAATIARLVAAGLARVTAEGKVLEATTPGTIPGDVSPVEAEVLRQLPLLRDERASLNSTAKHAELAFAERRDELREAGYLLSGGRAFATGIVAALPIAAVVLFLIVPRLIFGIQSGKPVGLLAITLLVTCILGMVVFIYSVRRGAPRLSRRGRYVLKQIQKTTHTKPGAPTDPTAIAWSVGMAGTSVLVACEEGPLTELASWYPRKTTHSGDGGVNADGGDFGLWWITSSSGGCGTGCGTSSGGGGGGCGGGGGGGCGGGCGGGGCGGCGG